MSKLPAPISLPSFSLMDIIEAWVGVWDFSVCGRQLAAKTTCRAGQTTWLHLLNFFSCAVFWAVRWGEISFTGCTTKKKWQCLAVVGPCRGFPLNMKLPDRWGTTGAGHHGPQPARGGCRAGVEHQEAAGISHYTTIIQSLQSIITLQIVRGVGETWERDQQCVSHVWGRTAHKVWYGYLEEEHRFKPTFQCPRFNDIVPSDSSFSRTPCVI